MKQLDHVHNKTTQFLIMLQYYLNCLGQASTYIISLIENIMWKEGGLKDRSVELEDETISLSLFSRCINN